eukprot:g78720.t1
MVTVATTEHTKDLLDKLYSIVRYAPQDKYRDPLRSAVLITTEIKGGKVLSDETNLKYCLKVVRSLSQNTNFRAFTIPLTEAKLIEYNTTKQHYLRVVGSEPIDLDTIKKNLNAWYTVHQEVFGLPEEFEDEIDEGANGYPVLKQPRPYSASMGELGHSALEEAWNDLPVASFDNMPLPAGSQRPLKWRRPSSQPTSSQPSR